MMGLHIRNARLIDPDQELDTITSLYIADGKIAGIGTAPEGFEVTETLEADAQWLVPGFIDLSSQLCEPGLSNKGTIASETLAAAHAGFTTVCTLPSTNPVADSTAVIRLIQEKAEASGFTQVLPLGALTQKLEGDQLANMVTLTQTGCVALSNARYPIKDSYVLRRLMEYAAAYDILLFLSADDPALSRGGVMHEGMTANRLGLAGIPSAAETVALAQILILVEQTGVRAHISQISCARSVEMIREAKERGLRVTADVAFANLCYTAREVNGFDSRFHLQPPLRREIDRQALLAAVNAGELAICTNHHPHEIAAKKAPFADSEPGMSLYDCFIPMLLERIQSEELSLFPTLRALTSLPASTIGLQSGLITGSDFNATLIDPLSYEPNRFYSKGGNRPVDPSSMAGRVKATFIQGRQSIPPISKV
ncbi:MAG: dihydroorotase [Oceanobacter sp.]